MFLFLIQEILFLILIILITGVRGQQILFMGKLKKK